LTYQSRCNANCEEKRDHSAGVGAIKRDLDRSRKKERFAAQIDQGHQAQRDRNTDR
jgi:hypothetical protein